MFDNQHDLGKTVHGDKPRVIRILHKAYSRWATFVVGHAWWLICICLLASALGAYKMVTTKRENSIRGYTPYGARALHEFDVRDQFFDQTGTGIRFFVLLLPKDNSTREKNNLLTEESLKEAVQIDNFIQNNLTIFNHVSGRKESFNQICRKFCTINEPVRQFYNGYKHQMDRLAQGDSLNYRIKLDYPIAEIFGRSVSLQPNFFGVHLREDSRKLIGSDNQEEDQVASLLAGNNSSTQNETAAISAKLITNMDRVEMIVLLYRAERIGGWSDAEIRDYEMSVSNYFKKDHVGKHIRVMTISSTYVSRELDRAAKTLMPFVGLGLLVMICCSVVTCTLAALFTGQFSFYRLPLTIIACLCPFMASGTALGILFLFGLRNSSILGVSPFLVLAIGVDDAFLMIHAWNALNKHLGRSRKQALSVEEYVAARLSMVLEETGPAILISAMTNILADAVGSFTGSPEITLLCIANMGAIVVDFFYQISLFTSVMALCAIYEERSLRKKSEKSVPGIEAPEKDSNKTDSLDGSPKASLLKRSQGMFNEVVQGYVATITSIPLATVVCLFWAVFIAFCFRAMLNFEINLTTRKLFPRDSPLLEIETYREEKYCQTTVPPNYSSTILVTYLIPPGVVI